MKRILTLLLVAGAMTATHAQTSKDDARRIILGDGNGNNNGGYGNGRDVILGGGSNNGKSYPSYPGNYPSGNNRQYQIDQVNREYDNKVQSIRNNPYLSYDEKERAIRQLERDRQKRLNDVYQQYNNGNNGGYSDCDNDRRDNGKHKGWDKKNNWKKGGRN